jgi:hypothetical protein
LLTVTVLVSGAAFGALTMSLQPSAQRLVFTAIAGLLAPLFWPGAASTVGRTAIRISVWSIAIALLTLMALMVFGGARQPIRWVAVACMMLVLVLMLTHSLAAAIELHLRKRSVAEGVARERAGRTAAIVLGVIGALPLWFGPTAEVLARTEPWIIDAVVGMSPLTHLAIASGNDLLRNEWLYDHSNLSRLAVSYPGLAPLLVSYGSILLALALVALAQRSPWRRFGGAGTTRTTMEDVTS